MNTISDTVCIIFVHFYIAVCNVRKSLINRIIYRIIVCSLLFNLLLTTTRIQSTNRIRKNLLSCKHISMTVFKSECLISCNKERNRGLHTTPSFLRRKKGEFVPATVNWRNLNLYIMTPRFDKRSKGAISMRLRTNKPTLGVTWHATYHNSLLCGTEINGSLAATNILIDSKYLDIILGFYTQIHNDNRNKV